MSPRSPLSDNFQTQQATNSTPNEAILKFSPTTDNRGDSDLKPQSSEPNPQDDNNDGQKGLIE